MDLFPWQFLPIVSYLYPFWSLLSRLMDTTSVKHSMAFELPSFPGSRAALEQKAESAQMCLQHCWLIVNRALGCFYFGVCFYVTILWDLFKKNIACFWLYATHSSCIWIYFLKLMFSHLLFHLITIFSLVFCSFIELLLTNNCVNLRHTVCCFDTFIYYKMMAIIVLTTAHQIITISFCGEDTLDLFS